MPDIHYMNPRLAQVYNVSDQPFPEEKAFYLSLAGTPPARVLDLGCGVGNLAHGFREAGHDVTGVDPAPAMLDVAAGKPGGVDIEWVHSTAQDFRSDKRFDLILMTGHAFQVLLSDEDIRTTLRTMHDHIAPGGTLAFETRNPAIDWAARWSDRPASDWQLGLGNTVTISTNVLERSDSTISFEHYYHFPDEDLTSSSTLRFTTRADIEQFLDDAGFCPESCYGDWDLTSFAPETSPEMIFVARSNEN